MFLPRKRGKSVKNNLAKMKKNAAIAHGEKLAPTNTNRRSLGQTLTQAAKQTPPQSIRTAERLQINLQKLEPITAARAKDEKKPLAVPIVDQSNTQTTGGQGVTFKIDFNGRQ